MKQKKSSRWKSSPSSSSFDLNRAASRLLMCSDSYLRKVPFYSVLFLFILFRSNPFHLATLCLVRLSKHQSSVQLCRLATAAATTTTSVAAWNNLSHLRVSSAVHLRPPRLPGFKFTTSVAAFPALFKLITCPVLESPPSLPIGLHLLRCHPQLVRCITNASPFKWLHFQWRKCSQHAGATRVQHELHEIVANQCKQSVNSQNKNNTWCPTREYLIYLKISII